MLASFSETATAAPDLCHSWSRSNSPSPINEDVQCVILSGLGVSLSFGILFELLGLFEGSENERGHSVFVERDRSRKIDALSLEWGKVSG